MADATSSNTSHESGTEVRLDVSDGEIVGDLHRGSPGAVQGTLQGTVVFAHGSGSSRFSPRNRQVAERLRRDGLGTLLLDLLTEEEEEVDRRTREHRFDISLLTDRVIAAMDWLQEQPELGERSIGLFGSSTGAAAALSAAGERPDDVDAVVSRGGRTDLARVSLDRVTAPTRFIVGGRDPQVLELNERSLDELGGERDLSVVEGATHLFEEPGALEEVADLAAEWFVDHLSGGDGP